MLKTLTLATGLCCLAAPIGGCGSLDDDDDAGSALGPGPSQDDDGTGGSRRPFNPVDAGPTFDAGPPPECLSVAEAICDGPEDCPGGQMCCVAFDGQGYSQFSCEDSCAALTATGDVWSQVCHLDEMCETDGYQCLVSVMYLPRSFARCRDTGTAVPASQATAAGEINCGEAPCGAGQKCCVRQPKEPYCTAVDSECACDGEPADPEGDAGTGEDAGA